MQKVDTLTERRAKPPERVAVREVTKGKPVVKLASGMGQIQMGRELIDIPEQVHQGDFVLEVTEGVGRSKETLSTYVVTE